MADTQSPQRIAAQLRELQRTSPTRIADVEAWEASARKFSEGLCIELPIQIMHYLHDADIRAKDPEYRAAQDEALSAIIFELERGRIPPSTGVTLSFHPRWLGAAALAAVAAIYWIIR